MGMSEKEKVMQAFAARFRKALKQLGYSPNEQGKLQVLFGVSGQAARKWADGFSMPTSSRMPQVAEVLGVRRAWLQDGEDPMRPVIGMVSDKKGRYSANKKKEISLSVEEARLLHVYRKLTPKQRDAVHVVVEQLALKRK